MLGRRRVGTAQRELRAVSELDDWVRNELYALQQGGRRADAVAAIAASAAQETFTVVDPMPEWQNATSVLWRRHLARVWEFLAGDQSQYYALSRAVADFLSSPLNHCEGQDGPDDFDRPQTVAAYAAALSIVTWGVDHATTAVAQIFDAIDLKYEGDEEATGRWPEVQREVEFVQRVVRVVVNSMKDADRGYPPEVLAAIKR